MRRPDGVTLIELLIVIVILGILAATIALSVSGVLEDSEEASAELRRIASGLTSAFVDELENVVPLSPLVPQALPLGNDPMPNGISKRFGQNSTSPRPPGSRLLMIS